MSRAPYLGKDCGKNLNVLRDWGRVMDPIQFHARLPNHGHQVKLRICLAKTVMWSSSKDEPILDLLFRITGDPPLNLKFSSRTFASRSGRSAIIWKSQVLALLVASCEANKKVKTVWAISKSEKSRRDMAGFSDSSTWIPFAIFSLYFAESCIFLIQASMMQVMSPPAAILTFALAAHFANSS